MIDPAHHSLGRSADRSSRVADQAMNRSADRLTRLAPLCYRHIVLTQNAFSQSSRYQSYWWWYVRAEGASC